MNSIKSKITSIKNPIKTFKLNNKTYYPFHYFNHKNNYKFDPNSLLIINNQSYYLESK